MALAGCFQAALHRLGWEEGGEKKGEMSVPSSLIHYLASYLGGLSGQGETVSCGVGSGLQRVCL